MSEAEKWRRDLWTAIDLLAQEQSKEDSRIADRVALRREINAILNQLAPRLAWRSEPPDCEGWWWFQLDCVANPRCYEVAKSGDGFAWLDDICGWTTDFSDWWRYAGPLPIPGGSDG